jgi:HNH endonuclease
MADDPGGAFWAKVQRTDGCWLWLRASNAGGYGVLGWGGKLQYAHRVAWFLWHGSWPELELDHVCGVKLCVRPDRPEEHIRDTSHRENVLVGSSPPAKNAAKIYCPRGHILEEPNVRLTPTGGRVCRACVADRNLEARLGHLWSPG